MDWDVGHVFGCEVLLVEIGRLMGLLAPSVVG
jgi:hypothetical protein